MLAPVVGEFFVEWAREQGAYDSPSAKAESVIAFITASVHSWWFGVAIGFLGGLAAAFWAIKWVPEPQSPTAPPSTKDVPATVAVRRVALLAPLCRYALGWHPERTLQIIPEITYVPPGVDKPGSRVPVFYLKNLTETLLQDLVVEWQIDRVPVEIAVAESAILQKYSARIVSNFLGAPPPLLASAIPHKALSLEKRDARGGNAFSLPYQPVEIYRIEFIDAFSQVSVSFQSVFAGIEIYLMAKLAGTPMGTRAVASVICSVSDASSELGRFAVLITGCSTRPYAAPPAIIVGQNEDDAEIDLAFEIGALSRQ